MATFLSSRTKNLKVGISGYTDGTTVAEFIGNVDIAGLTVSSDTLINGILDVESGAVISNTGVPLSLFKYGTATPAIIMYGANGTTALPTQTLTGDVIGGLAAIGYGSSGWAGGPSARINVIATENNGGTTNRGADVLFETVANSGISLQERMRLTNAGRLGLGTSTPVATFHLVDSGGTPAYIERSGANGVYLALKDASAFSFIGSDAGTFKIQTPGSGYSDKLVVTSTGNVGIGTSSPSTTLDVNGTARISSVLTMGSYIQGTTQLTLYGDSSSSVPVVITANGKLGIGVTTPAADLTVGNSADIKNGTIRLGANALYYSEIGYVYGSNGLSLDAIGGGGQHIAFKLNGSEAARIDTAGRLGVGTSAPLDTFHVNAGGNYPAYSNLVYGCPGDYTSVLYLNAYGSGARLLSNAYTESFIINNGYTNNPHIIFQCDSVERLRITSAGNVGVGTGSPSAPLHVAGKIRFGNNANYFGEIDHDAGVTGANIYNSVDTGGTGGHIFQRNGSEQLRIDTAGRLGVGTSSPVFLTDILSGTANTGANVNNPSQLSVTGPNKALTAGGATIFVNSNTDFAVDTGGSIALSGRNTTGSTNSIVWSVIKGAKENATSTNTAGYLAFATQRHNAGALVEAMRLDSSGRLGVGTSAPSNKLEIVQNITRTSPPAAGASGHELVLGSDLYGIVAGTTLSGNSYIASTRWDGGAFNYSLLLNPNGGNVGIGTSSPSSALEISATAPVLTLNSAIANASSIVLQQAGTTYGRFRFDGNNVDIGNLYVNGATILNAGGGEKARIDALGRLMVGTSTGVSTVFAGSGQLQVVKDGVNAAQIFNFSSTGIDYTPCVELGRGRGTQASPSAALSADWLGSINFYGHDGTQFIPAAYITARADGPTGTNDMPGRLVFSTTADGTAAPTERMRIASNGDTTIKDASLYLEKTGLGNLQFTFDGSIASIISNSSSAPLVFGTNSTERLRITSDGSVGVGLTPVSYAGYSTLAHGGTTGATLEQRISGVLTGSLTTDSQVTLKSITAIPLVLGTSNTERLRITSDGKVGIGSSTDPGGWGAKLWIDDVSDSVFTINTTGSTALSQIVFRNSNANGEARLVNTTGGPLTYYRATGLEAVHIDTSGRVGIGTSAPAERLDLGGGVSDTVKLRFTMGGNVGTIGSVGSGVADGRGNLTFFTRNGGTEVAAMTIDGYQRVGVGTTSPDFTLDVNGNIGVTEGGAVAWHDGSGNLAARVYGTSTDELRFEIGSGASRAMTIDSSGRLLVGMSTARANFYNSVNATRLQTEGTNFERSSGAFIRNSNDASSPGLIFAKSRGTSVGSNTVVQSGDFCGEISFQGNDGSEFVSAAAIAGVIDGAPGANNMPGRLVFSTTADGASSPTERMRITQTGNVGIGTGSPITKLDVDGTFRATSNISVGAPTTSTHYLYGHTVIDRTGVSGSNPSLSIYSGGSTVAYIDGGGSIYASNLTLTGGLTTGSPSSPSGNYINGFLIVDRGAGTAGSNTWFEVRTGSTSHLFVNGNSQVGIGTNAPAEALHVLGNIRMSSVPGTNTNAALNVLFQTTSGTIDGGSSLTFNPGGDVLSVNGNAISANIFSGAGSLGVLSCANGLGQYDFRATNDSLQFISGSSESGRFDGSGRLLVGTSSVLDVFGTQVPLLQVYGTSTANRGRVSLAYNNAESIGPGIHFNKSPGMLNGLVSSGDSLGALFFEGGDGTQQIRGASIEAAVDGTPAYAATALINGQTYRIVTVGTTDFTLIGASANTVGTVFAATGPGTGTGTAILNAGNMPGRLVFSTTADGASSPTERMRIDSSGRLGIGTNSPLEKLDVNGDARINTLTIGRGGGGISSNTAIGVNALRDNLTGDGNTAIGYYALEANTTGYSNVAVGDGALLFNQTGYSNTATGWQALFGNTTGHNNTAYGRGVLFTNSSGIQNTGIGRSALYFNSSGDNNVGCGYRALYRNETANANTAIGYRALYTNVTGNNNTASGHEALFYNTIGYNNVATGYAALLDNVDGFHNVATGSHALFNNTSGRDNIASGYQPLYFNTIGNYNIAIGGQALYNNTGSDNITLGYQAGYNLTTGSGNVIIGKIAGTAALSDTMIFGTGNGAERFRVDSNGNFGIGTDAPATNLEIKATTPILRLEESSASSKRLDLSIDSFAVARISASQSASQLAFETAGNEHVRITADGKVGIGTTTPQNDLEVISSGNYVSVGVDTIGINNWRGIHFGYRENNTSYRKSVLAFERIDSSARGKIHILNNNSISADSATLADSRLTIQSDGNVGIGTSNPSTKLHVVGLTTFGDILNNTVTISNNGTYTTGSGAGTKLDIVYGGSTIAQINNTGTGARDGQFILFNEGTPTVNIAADASRGGNTYFNTGGNFGIGTTTPGYKLEVNGSFAATTKSFIIPHPTKEGYKLRHGSLEGPENGIYVRGRSKEFIIELPEYWTELVDPDSITVSLTPIGHSGMPRVEKIEDNKVYVFTKDTEPLEYFYMVNAERIDVEKLEVEIPLN